LPTDGIRLPLGISGDFDGSPLYGQLQAKHGAWPRMEFIRFRHRCLCPLCVANRLPPEM